jgi:hypothetical protein
MYYANEAENAQLARDCFEWVLEKSNEKEDLVKAVEGKAEAWFWQIATQENPQLFKEEDDEEFPFRTWLKEVITADRGNVIAVCYFALAEWWVRRDKRKDLQWFHLAWSLLRAKDRSPPPAFHYCYFTVSDWIYDHTPDEDEAFEDLPILLSAVEHLELFISTVALKDMYMLQRFVTLLLIIFCNLLYQTKGSPSAPGKGSNEFTQVI